MECVAASQCPAGSHCVAATHTCELGCATAEDCPLERPVCSASGLCMQCAQTADCASTPGLQKCNVQAGQCVQCLVPTDCSPTTCFDDCFTCVDYRCVWKT